MRPKSSGCRSHSARNDEHGLPTHSSAAAICAGARGNVPLHRPRRSAWATIPTLRRRRPGHAYTRMAPTTERLLPRADAPATTRSVRRRRRIRSIAWRTSWVIT